MRRWVSHSLLFAAIFALLAIRSGDALWVPSLDFEDGRDGLAFYFNNPGFANIFRFYAGYVSLIPNAIAWASVNFLPLDTVPYAFVLASTLIATISLFLLSLPTHSWLIEDPKWRAGFCLLLAVLPLSREFLVTNLNYSHWSILLLLVVLLTRRPLPTSTTGMTLWALAVALCAISNPLSIVCLPLLGIQFYLADDRRSKICITLLAMLFVAYQVFAVDHGSAQSAVSLGSFVLAVKVFLARVVCESFVGPRAVNLLIVNGESMLLYVAGAALLLLLGYLTISSGRPKRDVAIASVAVALAFAFVLLSVMTRYTAPDKLAIYLTVPQLQRYFYVPKIIMLSVFVWQILPRLQRALGRPPMAALKRVGATVATGIVVAALVLSNRFLYGGNVPEGLRVRQFINEVQLNLAKADGGQPYQAVHHLPRDWGGGVTMDIDQRRRNLK